MEKYIYEVTLKSATEPPPTERWTCSRVDYTQEGRLIIYDDAGIVRIYAPHEWRGLRIIGTIDVPDEDEAQ